MDQAQNGEANGRAIRGRSRGGDNTPSEVSLMGALEKPAVGILSGCISFPQGLF
jgi:hypothetical protein